MSILEEMEKQQAGETQQNETVSSPTQEAIPTQGIKERFSFLFAQSPDEPIENYINHPMNFAKSEGLAQMLRGMSGMLGELRYAIIDIVVGFLRFSNERKAGIKAGAANDR